MKFRREYMIGGTKKDTTVDDYIARYVGENGIVIECQFGFSNTSYKWYEVEVDGEISSFNTLKEAKMYAVSL